MSGDGVQRRGVKRPGVAGEVGFGGVAVGGVHGGGDRGHRVGDHPHVCRADLSGGQCRGGVGQQRGQHRTTERATRGELPGVRDSRAGLGGREVQHPGEELFATAESGRSGDVTRIQFRDRGQHHGMKHPRHRFNIADLIPQPGVVAVADGMTPLVEAGGHRLPHVQSGLYHVTIVAPTPDNFVAHLMRRERSYSGGVSPGDAAASAPLFRLVTRAQQRSCHPTAA